MLSSVQQKISCIYESKVIPQPSSKRAQQGYTVVAGDTFSTAASENNLDTAHPSEKLDGTCVFISTFQDKPWLWVRYDRKPNKTADKRFKKYQALKNKERKDNVQAAGDSQTVSKSNDQISEQSDYPTGFQWSISDFKEAPDNWVPASGVAVEHGIPLPDANGHILGWAPLEPNFRGHCWHLSTVDLASGVVLVLQPSTEKDTFSADASTDLVLSLTAQPLSELMGVTMELIGTNVNGNPYHLGSKHCPVHCLVQHGIIPFKEKPPLDYASARKWFVDQEEGQVEGIVWHCDHEKLLKLHRHHLQLKWPVSKPRLMTLPVTVTLGDEYSPGTLLDKLKRCNAKTFQSVSEIQYE